MQKESKKRLSQSISIYRFSQFELHSRVTRLLLCPVRCLCFAYSSATGFLGWWFDEVNKVVLVAEKARLVSVQPAFASLTLQQIDNRSLPDKYPARHGEATRLVWMPGHPSLLIPLETDETSTEKPNTEAPVPVITVS